MMTLAERRAIARELLTGPLGTHPERNLDIVLARLDGATFEEIGKANTAWAKSAYGKSVRVFGGRFARQ